MSLTATKLLQLAAGSLLVDWQCSQAQFIHGARVSTKNQSLMTTQNIHRRLLFSKKNKFSICRSEVRMLWRLTGLVNCMLGVMERMAVWGSVITSGEQHHSNCLSLMIKEK
jgi:hypothetical protein